MNATTLGAPGDSAQPIIALSSGDVDRPSASPARHLFVQSCYDAVITGGALPLPLPLDCGGTLLRSLRGRVAGLLVCGGPDLGDDPVADKSDLDALKEAMALEVPVLGNCRGAQVLNVAHGGTLTSHVPGHRTDALTSVVSSVQLEAPLSDVLGAYIRVPCRHHQAVYRLGDGVERIGRANDWTTEAIWIPSYRPGMYGVQWHCDEDAPAYPLIRWFVAECAAWAARRER